MISKFTSAVRTGILAAALVAAAQITKAQLVTVNEGFDNNIGLTTFPNAEFPFGWTSGKIGSADPNNYWDRVNSATSALPAAATHLGSVGMMRYRSAYELTSGDRGYLVSRPYDLSQRGAGTSTISFWTYREGTGGNDMIHVYANTSPDPVTGAPVALTDAGTAVNYIPRPCATVPADPCNAWTQHTFTVPAGAPYTSPNVYFIIDVTDNGAAGANVYIDDFQAQTYPANQAFSAVSLDFQNLANVSLLSTNNWIIGLKINVTGEAAQCAMGAFQFVPNGCSSPGTDITANSAKLWWTGGTNSFSLTNAVYVGNYVGGLAVPNFTITPNAAAFATYGGGLLNGNNYFWLTYDIPNSPPAISNDYVDADFINAIICGTTYTCGGVGCTIAGGRLIDVAYCVPPYTAGTSWLNGSYTNNDYVKHVICLGDPAYPPGLDNDHNDIGPNVVGSGSTGVPNDPCVPAGGCTGGNCPFSVHGPDYYKYPIASVPSMGCAPVPPGGNCSRTAVFLETAVAPPTYNLNVQCGTWYGANAIAAWIDFNHDGVFNNAMAPAGEKILQSPYMNNLTWYNANFQVPVTGYYGTTTMRVREWYANNNMDPCSPGYYGEVEDYTITLRPDCSPIYPGWKIWLGYTDDWNVNSNWCGGVPTINDNALIPGKGAFGYNRGAATYHPVIKSGVLATTKKLEIVNDTVEVNAPVPGSLRISDSLSIGVATTVNTSALIVDSSYLNKAVMLNGLNTSPIYLPFRGSVKDMKMQLMYKTAELVGQGMIDQDVIYGIEIPIRGRKSTNTFDAVTIKMYYATNNATYPFFTTTGFIQPPPAANTLAPQNLAAAPQPTGFGYPVTVFSGVIDLTTIPINAAGFKTVNLTTPFSFFTAAGPLIVEICFTKAVLTADDWMWQTQTVGYKSVLCLNNSNVAIAGGGCGIVGTAGLAQKLANDFRPNFNYLYRRTFTKYPINMETNGVTTAQWGNFGNFVPANSIVTFMGTSATIQNIDGSNITTFDELKVNRANANVNLMKANTIVNDTLWLQQGKLALNAKLLTLNNNTPGAITQIAPNGYLYSEDLPPNYGLVEWKMGANLGVHTFPFKSYVLGTNVSIPFIYDAKSGTADVTVGTYYPSTTPPSLLPWPTGVTTINSYNNPAITDAPNLVRRFWAITNTGAAPNADLTFTWGGGIETPTNGAAPLLQSQRWAGGAMTWDYPAGGQSNLGNSVKTFGVTIFNTPWVLSRQPEPLPVSLLTFTAKPEKNKVRLDWVTASETNCDKFLVERTADASDYTFVNEVKSKGPSSGTLSYYTYDNTPLMGKSFYRLTQRDLNGADTYSRLVQVNLGTTNGESADKFEITQVKNYDDGSMDVIFSYNSELPLTYRLVDKLGRLVLSKTVQSPTNGLNIININQNLSSGIYTLVIQSQSESIARKIYK